ncbi:MAG: choice-of-anchor Q domain-containing protein [Acidobacteriota bacterium]
MNLRAMICGLCVAPLAAAALATTITVNSLTDGPNADDGVCTLREAIASSNANADVNAGFAACRDAVGYGADLIRFSVGGTLTISTTLPSFTDTAETRVLGDLDADGDPDVSVSGGGTAVPFVVDPGARARLDRLSIGNGHSGLGGGGILNFGTLHLDACTVSGNTADGDGAGVLNSAQATLVVQFGVFVGNTAGHDGGAIATEGGNVSVFGTELSSNHARSGGAMYALAPANVSLQNSWLLGNTATLSGGAVWSATSLFLSGSTLSGNATDGDGGGVFEENGDLRAANSTISGNSALHGGGLAMAAGTGDLENVTLAANGASVDGGAIFTADGVDLTLSNTLVAQSSGAANCGGGTIIDGTANLDDGTSCGFGGGSLTSATPGLGPLADHGGSTPTHALLTGSDAIDAGLAATCASVAVGGVDQRGNLRPVDGDGDGTARCDIGAFEAGSLPVVAVPTLGQGMLTSLAILLGILALGRLRRHARGRTPTPP